MSERDKSGSLVGRRYRTGNHGVLVVHKDADLADPHRIVGLVKTEGKGAGWRFGVPAHELGSRFPEEP
jgi:hypothetical protein